MPKRKKAEIFILLHSEGDTALAQIAKDLTAKCGVEALVAHSRAHTDELMLQAVNIVAVIARPWIFCHTTKQYEWAAEVCNRAGGRVGNKLPIALMADMDQVQQARGKADFPEDAVNYDPDTGSTMVILWLNQILRDQSHK